MNHRKFILVNVCQHFSLTYPRVGDVIILTQINKIVYFQGALVLKIKYPYILLDGTDCPAVSDRLNDRHYLLLLSGC